MDFHFKLQFIVLIINLIYLVLSEHKLEKCIIEHNECNCESSSDITCNTSLTDLSFGKLFKTIKGVHNLDKIFIQNSHLIKLPNNAFGNVSFREFYIHHNENLTTIEENAFKNSENRTNSVYLHSCSIKGNSVFKAISKLKYLTVISLDDNQLEEIPNLAFDGLTHLKMIFISQNKIKVLGQKAFYSSVSIDFINLGNNVIKQLDSDAFAFENSNHSSQLGPLRISLKINAIVNISEFVFRGLKRPVNLDISFNNLTQLKKETFEGVLKYDSTKIIAKGNAIECNCNVKWIFENANYKHKFSGPLRCADKKYFDNLTEKQFKNCTFY